MNVLYAKAGVGKSVLSRSKSWASNVDSLIVQCLYGRLPYSNSGMKLSKRKVEYEDVTDRLLFESLNNGKTEFRFITNTLYFYDKDGFLFHSDSFSEADLSARILHGKDHIFNEKPNILRIYIDGNKTHLYTLSIGDVSYFGFDVLFLLLNDMIRYDGIPYIENSEGSLSIETAWRFTDIGKQFKIDSFDLIGHTGLSFIDSVTSDIYNNMSGGPVLSRGIPASFPTKLAKYNTSEAIALCTPVYNNGLDALANFNFLGYTSGLLYIERSEEIKTSDQFYSNIISDKPLRLYMTRRKGDRSALYEIINGDSGPITPAPNVNANDVVELSCFLNNLQDVSKSIKGSCDSDMYDTQSKSSYGIVDNIRQSDPMDVVF